MYVAIVAAAAALLIGAQRQPQETINVVDLCELVAGQYTDGGNGYAYRNRLYSAAGVDPNADTRDVIRIRMQAWWGRNQHLLNCNVLNSTVNGHILKLAVDRSSGEFLKDVTWRWRLDVNHVDANGGTVLDFIDQELVKARASGSPRVETLLEYEALFERYGGLRQRELPT